VLFLDIFFQCFISGNYSALKGRIIIAWGNAPGAGVYDVGATPQVPVFMKLGNAPGAGVYEIGQRPRCRCL